MVSLVKEITANSTVAKHASLPYHYLKSLKPDAIRLQLPPSFSGDHIQYIQQSIFTTDRRLAIIYRLICEAPTVNNSKDA
jgi:hypothetical protein